MGKFLNSTLTILCLALLVFPYTPFAYAPYAAAASIENGSAIINGSISGIPPGGAVTVFIVNNGHPLAIIPGITSSNNLFSTKVSANNGDKLGFLIDAKDTGVTVTFQPGISTYVQLQYSPPSDNGGYIAVPGTPAPTTSAPLTTTTTPMPTSVPTPTPKAVIATGYIISSPTPAPPMATINAPLPPQTTPVNWPLIYAIAISIILIGVLIVSIRKI